MRWKGTQTTHYFFPYNSSAEKKMWPQTLVDVSVVLIRRKRKKRGEFILKWCKLDGKAKRHKKVSNCTSWMCLLCKRRRRRIRIRKRIKNRKAAKHICNAVFATSFFLFFTPSSSSSPERWENTQNEELKKLKVEK